MRLVVVGIDISKDWFDADIPEFNYKERFDQTPKGFKHLLKRFKKHGIDRARICMEATGLYYEKLAEFLHSNGHEVVVANPQCVRAFSRSELSRSKSDPLDAALIAKFCEQKYDSLHLWQPLPAENKQVREILRRRQALVDARTAEKNRLKAGFSSQDVLASIRKQIKFLDEEIQDLERLAREFIRSSAELKELVDLVASIEGVGWRTAATVLVEVPRELWNGRLAATYAGVIPSKNSSGKSTFRSSMSRIGSARLRQVLYMPALVASQVNPILKDFYQRLLDRGLKKKQALTALMRKLLHLVFGVIRTGKRFDPLHESNRRLALKQG